MPSVFLDIKGGMPTVSQSLHRAGYNVVDRPRPSAADDDLSVNHRGVILMSAADVSLSPIAVTQPTTFELVETQLTRGRKLVFGH